MKKLILILLLTLCFTIDKAFAQPYGNEWINHSQTYYKIKTAQNGLYRVDYDDLQEVGFPVNSIDPRKIKLFHRGEEVAINFQGQNDARFDTNDYLEFYGIKNDGVLDERLYLEPEAQPHQYYSIYSDTTTYFLTWSVDGSNGKRISKFKENNVTNIPVENYHLDEKMTLQTSNYSAGLAYPIGQASAQNYITSFDYGEGWTGPRIRKGESQDFSFSGMGNKYSAGTALPKLEMVLAGRNNLQHKVNVLVGPSATNLRNVASPEFSYYYTEKVSVNLQWSDISADGNIFIRIFVVGVDASADFVSVSYLKLIYPEQLNQNNILSKYYQLRENAGGKSYVEIDNFPNNARIFDITDQHNVVQIEYNRTGSDINAIVPNTSASRKLYATNEYLSAPSIQRASFRNFNPDNHNYIIVYHPRFKSAGGEYSDVVQAYASYRGSSEGGSFDTLSLSINQLYDQFNYGEVSSMAMYNLFEYFNEQGDPDYFLIIGKGLTPNYNSHRQSFATQDYPDLVPTGGYPGNDAIFSVGLRSPDLYPKTPVGRISATVTQEVANYLNKVKENAQLPYDELWRKQIIHLSGGITNLEQTLFKSFVNDFESTAENIYLGGQVTTQSKKTNNETELINIAEEINQGKSLVTFFGHSSSSTTDIEIGYCSNDALGYANKGKYPTILVNGCNAGDAYYPGFGFGLDWVFIENKGAIAFIAHTGIGNSSTLKRYTDAFYEVGFADSSFIGAGIGDIQIEVSKRYLDRYLDTPLNIAQSQQMALQGDPAVKLFGAQNPDYSIDNQEVYVESPDGQPINVFTESFELAFNIKNFGIAIEDSLDISVSRELSNGTVINLDTINFESVLYEDTLYFTIPSAGIESFGINTFTITLNPENDIQELSKANNIVSLEYFIPLGSTINRYPTNLSIIDTSAFDMITQSLDLLMDQREVLFEIDTTDTFNSSAKQSGSVSAKVVAKWPVDLKAQFTPQDTTVFYWRTKFANPREGELDEWNTSSFTYIENGDEGWNMSHFPQFNAAKTEFITKDASARKWEFEEFSTELSVKTYGANNPNYNYTNVEIRINDITYIFPGKLCADNTLNMVSFRQSTTAPYLGDIGLRACGRVPTIINNFRDVDILAPREYIVRYLDKINEGDFVLVFSIGSLEYGTFPVSTLDALEEIGIPASEIQNINTGEPFIALGQKGMSPGEAIIIKANPSSDTATTEQTIVLNETIEGTITEGTITSPDIGPANAWDQFYFELSDINAPFSDINNVAIIGIDDEGNENTLYQNIGENPFDLSGVNASQYKNLRIQIKTTDEDNLDPAQVEKLLVTYEGVPDGILTYNDDTDALIEKQEGEEISSSFSFENISKKDFGDSISVSYNYLVTTSNTAHIDTMKIKPLKKWEKTDFDIKVDTRDKVGESDLRVFANPYLQDEISYNNNLIELEDYALVNADETNPILEVTFDGQYIMDGDIVAPSPQILVRMKDENEILRKKDTTGLEIMLKKPCEGCELERINFSNPAVTWSPASENSDFSVEYNPGNLEDGVYTLSVQAVDESGNAAGSEPYQVNFEVINESTITNFFPYPNPFSTSTRFAFTLTGSELPDNIIIQIMTVSGIVVREITMDELGMIRIGNNLSEFAWNGTDEFGDQLANGVYLYRVKVYKNGEPVKPRATSADRAFKNGVGKMYLLR